MKKQGKQPRVVEASRRVTVSGVEDRLDEAAKLYLRFIQSREAVVREANAQAKRFHEIVQAAEEIDAD